MPRPPRRITAARLQRVTAHYLERYSTSVANLRRVLMRRVHRAAAFHGDDPADGARLVDEELARLERLGFLDDAAYARGKARSLLRRGNGTRLVRARLQQKGVDTQIIDAVLEEVEEELGHDPQRLAAALYARKRALGPWRRPPRRPEDPRERRRKDLQRMARAGFGYELAASIVDVAPGSPEAEELDDLVLTRRTL